MLMSQRTVLLDRGHCWHTGKRSNTSEKQQQLKMCFTAVATVFHLKTRSYVFHVGFCLAVEARGKKGLASTF